MKALITYGGTTESIDKIRSISNQSSGKTGLHLANHLSKYMSVSVIRSNKSPKFNEEDLTFENFDQLDSSLKYILESKDFDIVIQCAAVSDYKVSGVTLLNGEKPLYNGGKLQSNQELKVHLSPTPKLIQKLRFHAKNKSFILVGFKLTDNSSADEIQTSVSQVFEDGADFVVHNDLNNINETFHKGSVFTKYEELPFLTKQEMASRLTDILLSTSNTHKENQ